MAFARERQRADAEEPSASLLVENHKEEGHGGGKKGSGLPVVQKEADKAKRKQIRPALAAALNCLRVGGCRRRVGFFPVLSTHMYVFTTGTFEDRTTKKTA